MTFVLYHYPLKAHAHSPSSLTLRLVEYVSGSIVKVYTISFRPLGSGENILFDILDSPAANN